MKHKVGDEADAAEFLLKLIDALQIEEREVLQAKYPNL